MQYRATALGACNCDIGQPAFFLEACKAALVDGALAREYAFFPAGQEDVVEFQPLGGVHGHYGDLLAIAGPFIVHYQADMLEEIAKRLVFFHRPREFGEVLEPPRAFGAAILLQHVFVAAFRKHAAQQFRWGDLVCLFAPVNERAQQGDKVVPRPRRQFVGIAQV